MWHVIILLWVVVSLLHWKVCVYPILWLYHALWTVSLYICCVCLWECYFKIKWKIHGFIIESSQILYYWRYWLYYNYNRTWYIKHVVYVMVRNCLYTIHCHVSIMWFQFQSVIWQPIIKVVLAMHTYNQICFQIRKFLWKYWYSLVVDIKPGYHGFSFEIIEILFFYISY